jgi:hypothetical protein
MSRGGLDFGLDIRLTAPSKYFELHVHGGVSVAFLKASGAYCLGADGYGRDCDEDPTEAGDTQAEVSGTYPTIYVGSTLVLLGDVPYFHGINLGIHAAGGTIPRIKNGKYEADRPWFGLDLHVTAAVGGEVERTVDLRRVAR